MSRKSSWKQYLSVGLLATTVTAIGGSFCSPLLALSVRQISSNEQQTIDLKVWEAHGINLSFMSLGETIRKVWLDDPSQFVLNADGCLENLSADSCPEPGASVLHIRRIKPINFPGLPRTPPGSGTHLTVITQVTNGGRKIYSFRLLPGSGQPEYSTIEITAAPLPISNQTLIASIRQGLEVAQENQQISRNDPLWSRIETFLGLLENGQSVEQAAAQAQISMALVRQLNSLGDRGLTIPNSSI
ncbi:MAG TPA: hypothetical protein DCL61_15470 [Cyanobacteria bacterium UBA12227]|nr:hypothetical protein [Cyanobacteria bacterium UBA12227]HAX88371.1 hypothetical protein [Cyanobacteria bacterium UBA11370]HBY77856.1 hypothetical protein [Cyanobacteria bacterium UBA11148]